MDKDKLEHRRKIEAIVAILLCVAFVLIVIIVWKQYNKEPEEVMENNLAAIVWDNFIEDKVKVIAGECETKHIEYQYDDTMRNGDFESIDYNNNLYYSADFLIEEEKLELSQVLFKKNINDNKDNFVTGYKIKTISEEYAIAIKYNNQYYKYINTSFRPQNLSKFLELIGPKENVEIAYVEVVLGMDAANVASYIYKKEIDKWVWSLFENREHEITEKGIGHHSHRVEEDTVLKWADVYIRVENKKANIEYLIQFGLDNDTVGIYDTRYGLYEYCFEFDTEELSEALNILTEDYEAYKVK